MPLIKHGQLADDPWVQVADEVPLPPDVQPIISLERWRAEREILVTRNAPLGIRLKSDQSPAEIAEDLEHFEVIALEFPKFTDGRAYSSARLLRERYGYEGELRAVGVVLRDQFLFLQRSGFDAFEVADEKAATGWAEAIAEISVAYQPAADARRPALALRQEAVEALRKAQVGKGTSPAAKPRAKKVRPAVTGGAHVMTAASPAVSCARRGDD